MPAGWSFVVASSGIQADKADSVKDRYNRASNGARALHELWNRHSGEPAQSLCAALAAGPRAVERLEEVDRRRRHVQRRRVASAAQTLHSRDGARPAGGPGVSRCQHRSARSARLPTRSAMRTSCSATRSPKRSRWRSWRARSAHLRRVASAPASAAAYGPPCRRPTRSALAKSGCAPTLSGCPMSARSIGSSRGPGPPATEIPL